MLAHHPLEGGLAWKEGHGGCTGPEEVKEVSSHLTTAAHMKSKTQHTTTLRVGQERHGATCLHGKDRGPSHSQPAATGSRL